MSSDGSTDYLSHLTSAVTTAFTYLRMPALASSGLAAVLTALLYFKQNELIYPRHVPAGSRDDVFRPRKFGWDDYEELHLPTPDGEKLGAYLLRPAKGRRRRKLTMLMFHGNAGNIGHRLPIALRILEDSGCNVLMLEYRGYGFSTGTPHEQGLMLDAQTGFDYIRQRADLRDDQIVIYGQSLGGAVTIQLAARNGHDEKLAGLILENTFVSMRKLIPSVFPPAKYLSRLCHQTWSSESVLPKITGLPILFLSGLKDELVPPEHMKQLYDMCRAEPKIWQPLANGTHNESVLEPGYFDHIKDFIFAEILAKR